MIAATDLFSVAADLGLLRGERVGEVGVAVEGRVGLLGNTALLGRGRGCSARVGVLEGLSTERNEQRCAANGTIHIPTISLILLESIVLFQI